MLRDLIKLANLLDYKGLNKEADIVDNIIKSAGQFEDYMAKEMGHESGSTLSPTEEPDITELSSDGEDCEEFTNACLGLMGVLDFENLDKFYDASIKFVNAIKNITNNDKLNYIVTPKKEEVVSQFGFLTKALNDRLRDGETEEDYSKRKELRGGDSTIKAIDLAITFISTSKVLGSAKHFAKEFHEETGISKSCLKSALLRMLEESDTIGVSAKHYAEIIEKEFS